MTFLSQTVCYKLFLSIGYSSLQKELTANVMDEQINRLCNFDGTSCQIFLFKQARVLDPYLEKIWAFSHDHPSDLFNKFWGAQLKAHCKNGTLTFDDIVKRVWIPVFKQCTDIHEQLISSKITLAQVDLFFKQYSGKEKALAQEIKSLHLAVQGCLEKDATNLKWIKAIITKMQQHWELSTYADTAHAFLKIRDALHLTGDFSLVERVAAQVHT